MRRVLILCLALVVLTACGSKVGTVVVPLNQNESVWGGRVADGSLAPFAEGFSIDLSTNTGNQVSPLLLTSGGTYIWSDEPFSFSISKNKILISKATAPIEVKKCGSTLREAFLSASKAHFPANGTLPPEEFYMVPQYNSWIELTYNQNQVDIIKYAKGILANGLPAGIMMIDDTWQDDYGKWEFDPAKFPNPKAMVDELHAMGFKVMLWVCPFVSMDQYQICRRIEEFNGFLRKQNGEPYPVRWWNGTSAVLDLSNPKSVEWFNARLQHLMDSYGIDGFKFDAGDFEYYPSDGVAFVEGTSGSEQCSLFVQLAEKYPYNELRAGYKNAGKAIVQRLHDKDHSWTDLQKLIPEMIAESLLGYSFCCPDMVGGGNFMAFEDENTLNPDLIVRSAQCHALMPMVQFSLAPWRVLDSTHYQAILEAMRIRNEHLDTIKALYEHAASTGEPIIAPLEYWFPNSGYASITDQFMLGEEILVAPMLTEGSSRKVVLPQGMWVSDTGDVFSGEQTIEENVPLNRLPHYIKYK